jgi:3-hydroxy-3-methylglutaryl CoA synthase
VILTGLSAYIPRGRLPLAELAAQWGSGPGRGDRSVAGHDEDALTMATTAALDCVDGQPPDAIWFASTSSPYLEKQSAVVMAAALDAARQARTIDIGSSLRGWTTGIAAAVDAVAAGTVGRALVAAGDVRPAEPDSPDEAAFGDAGGAALIEAAGDGAEVLAYGTVNDNTMGAWRRDVDRFVRHGERRFAMRTGEIAPAQEAAAVALERAGLQPGDLALLAVSASSPRVAPAVAEALGADATVVGDDRVPVGNGGAAHPAMLLATAVATAAPGQVVLLIATGDGADALVVRAGATMPRGCDLLAAHLANGAPITSYTSYLQRRGIVPVAASAPRSSPVAQRRDEAQYLRLHAMRCRSCGLVQYPITELCARCASPDAERVPLARAGAVHTFTTDHIVAGINPGIGESPITMAVIDLDDGARVFMQLTDMDADDVSVGMPVQLCFRRLHDGSDYHNYYWKARPAAAAGG